METIFVLIIAAAAIFTFVRFKQKKWEEKLMEVASHRPKLSRSAYIGILVEKGYDRRHVEVVYDEIHAFIHYEEFSMYPEDDLSHLYGIYDLEDNLLIENICERLDLQKPEEEDMDFASDIIIRSGNDPVFTAEHLLTLTRYLSQKEAE